MKKTLLTLCVFVSMGIQAQKLPQLGKDPINKIVAAMNLEEKATLLVGYQVSNAEANIIATAAGTTAMQPLAQATAVYGYYAKETFLVSA